MVQGAACVGFCVWLRNVALVETSVLMRCHGGFVSSLVTNFLVTCSILLCRDATQPVNNVPYLFVTLWRKLLMHNTVLIEEHCEQHFYYPLNLVLLSKDIFSSLKQRNDSKTWNPFQKPF
jgi:hypothetical protein